MQKKPLGATVETDIYIFIFNGPGNQMENEERREKKKQERKI